MKLNKSNRMGTSDFYEMGYRHGYAMGRIECKEELRQFMKKGIYAVAIAIAFLMVLMTPTATTGFMTALIKWVLWEGVWISVLIWAILGFEECHD